MGFKIVDVTVRGVAKKAVRYKEKGKYRRKYCDDLEAAQKWIRKYVTASKEGKADLITKYTLAQLDDIDAAFKILPDGYTLTECVQIVAKKFVYNKSLKECITEFQTIKKDAELSTVYSRQVKTRIAALNFFDEFDAIDPDSLIKLVNDKRHNGKPLAVKTKLHYLSAFREFFDWAKTRGYIKETPFAFIHDTDLPKLKKKNPDYPTVETTKKFFENAAKLYPEYVGIYALVAFGGIRVGEAERLVPSEFDFKNKRITIPGSKSKSGKNYEQTDMPANLWAWLKKYPPSEAWAEYYPRIYTELNRTAQIPNNGLRHAFATYHMSLYRRADKTQVLMRHEESSRKLWDTYLAGFVSKEVAAEYFSIKPA